MSVLFFPAAIWVDNQPLTDQGRAPVEVSRDERSDIVELATGKRKKYIKAIKHTFRTSWSWLVDEDSDTIDGGYARKSIKDNFGYSGDVHTLRFFDANGEWTEYTVFVSGYNETLIRRDPNSGRHFWEVSIDFEEQ